MSCTTYKVCVQEKVFSHVNEEANLRDECKNMSHPPKTILLDFRLFMLVNVNENVKIFLGDLKNGNFGEKKFTV